MSAAMFLLALAIYLAFLLSWAWFSRGKNRNAMWGGIVWLLLVAPISFYAGSFATWFDSNLCYSSALAEAFDLPAMWVRSGQDVATEAQRLQKAKESLEGYETSCQTVKEALRRLQ
jgi:hypothetical protein